MIGELLGPVIPYIIGALAFVAALWGWGKSKKEEGRRTERQEAQEADYENAADIRDRVDRNRDQRVRELDDAGYRD